MQSNRVNHITCGLSITTPYIWWLYLLVIEPNAGELYDVEGQPGGVTEEEHQDDGHKNSGERDVLLLQNAVPENL